MGLRDRWKQHRQRQARLQQIRESPEVKEAERKAYLEGYKESRIKVARQRGREEAQGGGGIMASLRQLEKSLQESETVQHLANYSASDTIFGESPKKKRKRK